MSHSIIYQSMSVKFPNDMCFVITQHGASNCTEFNFRTRREVLEKDWSTVGYCADSRKCYLHKEKDLLEIIKQNINEESNNNLESDSYLAYKSRGVFKPYSFWLNHFSNAVKRYSISAESFINRFKPLTVYVWGIKPDVTVTVNTVNELYQLFERYSTNQFSFSLSRDLAVSSLVEKQVQKTGKPVYYVYNWLDNGIYCKTHKRQGLICCCLGKDKNSRLLDESLEQYLVHTFHIKSILMFKSISACVGYFVDKDRMYVDDIYIGIYGQENLPTPETKLKNYLEKAVDYKG